MACAAVNPPPDWPAMPTRPMSAIRDSPPGSALSRSSTNRASATRVWSIFSRRTVTVPSAWARRNSSSSTSFVRTVPSGNRTAGDS
jgi:hypothetical protein